mmetsp:Transcript_25162/g.30990  ORF Transcript_25162/g.30990 Transcript_25162/m.30990 type:complete len:610 (+) Transcript_25162:178-2007(+)
MLKRSKQCCFILWLNILQHVVVVVNGGWVDPDTSKTFHSTIPLTSSDDREYQLVFSDEFETDGRSFSDGEDSRWTAIDKNDYTNDALHYYKSENARTTNGVLNITTELKKNQYKAFNEKTKKYYSDTKHVQSAMVQGWNKFCMTGGIVEYSAKLPGQGSIGGFWPALWLLGNLARATYVGSSNWMWPFSYDTCTEEIIHQQEVNACRKVGHYGMTPGIGRGAPEIDILEAMAGDPGKLPNTPIQRPYFSSSLQVAPGVEKNRPLLMHQPKLGHWYQGLQYGDPNTTSLNPFFYGVTLVHKPKEYTYQSDAISANTRIDESFFEKQNIYRVEWEPSTPGKNDGYIKWYVNGRFLFGINGENLNITSAKIPNEPMYLIMNTAVASSWGFPAPCPEGCDCSCFECGNSDCDCALPTGYCDNFPANFEIDYVRVWQAVDESKHQMGCSTKDRPTELFIKGHQDRYMEDGDTSPLQPIRVGGTTCDSDLDCGGSTRGFCSSNGVCECNKGYAGSTCLSNFGFDDHPYQEIDETLPVSMLSLPKGLVVAFVMIGMGFLITFMANVKKMRNDALDSFDDETSSLYSNRAPVTSRTGSPQQQKVVTYCMIDGRLIDK